MRTTTHWLTIALGLLALALAPTAAWPQAPMLFQALDQGEAQSLLDAGEQAIEDGWLPTALRRAYVMIDMDPLDAVEASKQGGSVTLNLFADTWLIADLHAVSDARRRAWVGTVDGLDTSRATLVQAKGPAVSPGGKALVGFVRLPGATYRLRKVGRSFTTAGLYAVEEVDLAALPLEAPPVGGSIGGGKAKAPRAGASPAPPAAPATTPAAPTKAIHDIDVLLVYTDAADDYYGGGIESLVFTIDLDTNYALGVSDTDAVMWMASQRVDFIPFGSANQDLSNLRFDLEVGDLRDAYGADLVQLLVAPPWDPTACGIGYVLQSPNDLGFESRAFSIARVDCAAQLTPTHELGHNMGACHAPEDGGCFGAFSYSYGYKDQANFFRTVMAYASGCAGCERIPQFSNPGVDYILAPTGTATQDNARTIDNTAGLVSGFRFFPIFHDLTVSRTGSGAGSVVSVNYSGIDCGSDCAETYPEGITVDLEASAAAGSSFIGWSGDCAGSAATASVVIDADKSCSAQFDDDGGGGESHVLTVTKSGTGSGTVTSAPGGINCGTGCQQDTATFDQGTAVTLTASAGAGSTFQGWSGACSGSGAQTTVTMSADKTCTAAFAGADDRTLTVKKRSTGSGTVVSTPAGIDMSCQPDCPDQAAPFADGSTVTLTAAASPGSEFDKWLGACSGSDPTTTVVMSADKTCRAYFDPVVVDSHTLSVSVGPGENLWVSSIPGPISCDSSGYGTCAADFDHGTSVTLVADGWGPWGFQRWLGDCEGTDSSVTITVDADLSCFAKFYCTTMPAECYPP